MASKVKKISQEEKSLQEERLTGKHIRTLLHVQELHEENERLKARVSELESYEEKAKHAKFYEEEVERLKKQLSRCEELHTIAAESRESMKQLQAECLAKMDEFNEEVTSKHQRELMEVMNAKLESERQMEEKCQEMEKRIEQLESENKSLKEKFGESKMDAYQLENLHEKLDHAMKEVLKLQNNRITLEQSNKKLSKELDEKVEENSSLKVELESSYHRISLLEKDLVKMKNAPDASDQYSLEILRLNQQIQSLENENAQLKEIKSDLETEVESLRYDIQDTTESLKSLYKEREFLKNKVTELLSEVALLKSQTENKTNFAEFIQLKRELNRLKDENEKLMRRKSTKPAILPALKADASVSYSSTVSLRSPSRASSKKSESSLWEKAK